jgi:thiamine-monophosphate kinase
MEQFRTELSDVGEFGFIDRISRIVTAHGDDPQRDGSLIKGISDDAAVFRPTPGNVQLFTTDAFVEGVHFDLTFTSLKHLGWKVIAANISDIVAMGGIPRYATVSLALPGKLSVEMMEELYLGISSACEKYSCRVVGGDTTSSLANMMVSVAMTGECSEQDVVYRSGAQPGDYLCVTGHLGASVAGLKILQREKKQYLQSAQPTEFRPNLEPYGEALEKHLMPKPRLDIVRLLNRGVKVHAMIDISDGLASEVHHLCASSNMGATIHEHNIPLTGITQRIAEEFSEQPTDYALYGGEEYELLFAITEEELGKLERMTNDVTIIGRITEKSAGVEVVREGGEHEALGFTGWDHFKGR